MTWLVLLAAARAVLELALWLMVGRGVLALIAGASGTSNGVLRLFDFLLRPVRALSARLFPRSTFCRRDTWIFLLLLLLWLVLGVGKFFVATS